MKENHVHWTWFSFIVQTGQCFTCSELWECVKQGKFNSVSNQFIIFSSFSHANMIIHTLHPKFINATFMYHGWIYLCTWCFLLPRICILLPGCINMTPWTKMRRVKVPYYSIQYYPISHVYQDITIAANKVLDTVHRGGAKLGRVE